MRRSRAAEKREKERRETSTTDSPLRSTTVGSSQRFPFLCRLQNTEAETRTGPLERERRWESSPLLLGGGGGGESGGAEGEGPEKLEEEEAEEGAAAAAATTVVGPQLTLLGCF